MTLPEVEVNRHSAEWLQKGFPWVYPNEVVRAPRGCGAGRVVRIHGAGGTSLGTGIWDDGWIAVRRFRPDDGPLDEAWIRGRVAGAVERRRAGLPPGTTAWRAVHAENDDLPGVRVDVWDQEVTVLLDSPSLTTLSVPLARALQGILGPRVIRQGWRPDPREKVGPWMADESCAVVEGTEGSPECTVHERGRAFLVRPGAGMDAGLFPDMRENRAWLDPWWAGATVLNLFAYTGAFSVFAALGGARRVVTEDLARVAITRARANFAANGLDPDGWEFCQEDAFHALDRFRRAGERFDRVVADPPSFSRSGASVFSAERDTARLVAACCRVLAPGGLLVLGNNQGTFSPREFQEAVRQGAWKARRDLRLVHTGSTPADYPASLTFPEGRYLKFWVLMG